MEYQVRKTWMSEWVSFGTAKEAVKYMLTELHDVGLTVGGYTYDDKFEELTWIEKGRIVVQAS